MTPGSEDSTPPQDMATIFIEGDVAHCQGNITSAHPGVYLHLDSSGKVICPYCSHVFKKQSGKVEASH